MKKITIIIPVYNEEKFILKTLLSLSNQTYKDFKVIIVDNNCIDDTIKICKSFIPLDLEVVKEKHKGIIPARMKGFEKATTKLVASTDADTIVDKNWIKEIIKGLDNVDFVYGDAYFAKYFWQQAPNLGKWLRTAKKGLPELTGMTNGANFGFKLSILKNIKTGIISKKNNSDRIIGINAQIKGFKMKKISSINIASARRFIFVLNNLIEGGTYHTPKSDFRNDEQSDIFLDRVKIMDEMAKQDKLSKSKFIREYIKDYFLIPVLLKQKDNRKYFSNLDRLVKDADKIIKEAK